MANFLWDGIICPAYETIYNENLKLTEQDFIEGLGGDTFDAVMKKTPNEACKYLHAFQNILLRYNSMARGETLDLNSKQTQVIGRYTRMPYKVEYLIQAKCIDDYWDVFLAIDGDVCDHAYAYSPAEIDEKVFNFCITGEEMIIYNLKAGFTNDQHARDVVLKMAKTNPAIAKKLETDPFSWGNEDKVGKFLETFRRRWDKWFNDCPDTANLTLEEKINLTLEKAEMLKREKKNK